ncbi:hypothetical protein NKJ73_33670 [Mesorhizobium sp. M0074]
MGKTEATQGADQDIRKRGEPQPQLIGAHGVGTGTIGVEVEWHSLIRFSMSLRAQ